MPIYRDVTAFWISTQVKYQTNYTSRNFYKLLRTAADIDITQTKELRQYNLKISYVR